MVTVNSNFTNTPISSRPNSFHHLVLFILRPTTERAAPGYLSVTSSSGHWVSLRCKVRRLTPIKAAALVRLPRALINASRNRSFSFTSTERDGPADPLAAGTDVGAEPSARAPSDEATKPRNLGSRSYSVSLPPRRRTTAFSQKLRSSRMLPGQA